MSATWHEQEFAQVNGVKIRHWAKPRRLVGRGGAVREVEFERTRLDDNGRLEGTGETYAIPCDMVFKAIGQKLVTDPLNGEAREALEIAGRTPGSLCFSTLSQITTENYDLKTLSFNGVRPSLKNLKDGIYPLFLKFSTVTAPDPAPSIRSFIEFIHSPAGRKTLEKCGNAAEQFQGDW
jgi:hypothetical protein